MITPLKCFKCEKPFRLATNATNLPNDICLEEAHKYLTEFAIDAFIIFSAPGNSGSKINDYDPSVGSIKHIHCICHDFCVLMSYHLVEEKNLDPT